MKVIFRGDPVELERGEGLSRTTLDLWGVHFKMGVETDVSHLAANLQAKLRTNLHFEVVEAIAAPASAERADEAAAPESAEAAEAALQSAQPKGQKKGTVKAGAKE